MAACLINLETCCRFILIRKPDLPLYALLVPQSRIKKYSCRAIDWHYPVEEAQCLHGYFTKSKVSVQLTKGHRFLDCQSLSTSHFDLWYRGSKPHPLPRDIPLAETDAPQDANLEISLTVYGMRLLTAPMVNTVPEALSSTPIPVAFQVLGQLSHMTHDC